VRDYADAQAADHDRYARFFHALLDPGQSTAPVFFAPSGYETLFVSLAHGDTELRLTLDAVDRAARAIA
jgi:glutamate-1-semialdehyde 2,1-aminomutase